MPAKPSIVFAHGLWADGSCYSKVIPALVADGHQVVSAQNSLDTLEGDVATVTRALGRVSSPAVLFRPLRWPRLLDVRPGVGGHAPPAADAGSAVISDNQPQSLKRFKFLQDSAVTRAVSSVS